MSTIEQLFHQAQLAEAAYADLSDPTKAVEALQDEDNGGGFSKTQAEFFVKNFRVVDQYTAPSLTGSGFSATVFQYIGEDVGGLKNGQYVFAVRGTEPNGSQLIDDLLDADLSDIGREGFSLRQALDLYNYQKSLVTTKGEGYQAVYLAIDLTQTAMLNASPPGISSILRSQLEGQGYWVEQTLGAYTVGKLALGWSKGVLAGTELAEGRNDGTVQLGGQYDVAGHSLGGHLAMILGRMDGGHIGNVATFNPPYFDPSISLKRTQEFFAQLKALDGNVADDFKDSLNLVVDTDPIHKLTATLTPGTQHLVFSEGDSWTSPLAAHDIKNIVDTLAVCALFAKLDPNLTLGWRKCSHSL